MRYLLFVFLLASCEAIDQPDVLDTYLPCTSLEVEDYCDIKVTNKPHYTLIEVLDNYFPDYGDIEYNLSVQYIDFTDNCHFASLYYPYSNIFIVPNHKLQEARLTVIRTVVVQDTIYSQLQSRFFKFKNTNYVN